MITTILEMKSYPTGVPVVDPEQCYHAWKADRDQMDTGYNSSMLHLERQFVQGQSSNHPYLHPLYKDLKFKVNDPLHPHDSIHPITHNDDLTEKV